MGGKRRCSLSACPVVFLHPFPRPLRRFVRGFACPPLMRMAPGLRHGRQRRDTRARRETSGLKRGLFQI
jgi:hypothetical protein